MLRLTLALAFLTALQDAKIETTKITDSVYALKGQGGNIGLCIGKDGTFLIDDQFAPMTEKIQAAIKGVGGGDVRFVLNTHWHGDHVGGNENFGKAGAVIVAHENVRKRMSQEQFMDFFQKNVPAAPEKALPVVTFPEQMTFHLNGDEIQIRHVKNAHTDGDSIVHFKKSNVLHLGDTFFNGMYPFIDLPSGGSIDGMIAAAKIAEGLADDKTKIIPGHGPLSDKKGLIAYRSMLEDIRKSVADALQKKQSREEILKSAPTQKYDEAWGKGFIKPEQFAGRCAPEFNQLQF